jgi:predicted RNA-binding Zn-ribbon protein involved in translation (DUF1610 family)
MGRREELLARAEARIINEYNISFAGMSIDGPVFRYNGREYPINTVTAEVVLGAQTAKSRSTATRIIGGGLVAGPGGMLLGGAWKKRADTSKVHITVRLGDGSVHTISRPTTEERALRLFADRLESAVNRKWPIKTPFGTTLELDPTSTRESHVDHTLVVLSLGAIGLAFGLLFVIKAWALLVGVVLIGAIIVFANQRTKAFERELDEHFPEWRGEGEKAEIAQQQRMWDNARKNAQDSDENVGTPALRPARPAVETTNAATTNAKCYACQHVQAVPVRQATYVCEQCGKKLIRKQLMPKEAQ